MKMKWVPFLRWLIRVERARHRRLTGKIIVCQICMILFLSLTTPSHSTTVFFFLFLFFPCPCLCGNTILFDQASAATLIFFFFFFFFSLILLCTWEKDKRTRIHSYTYNTIQYRKRERRLLCCLFLCSQFHYYYSLLHIYLFICSLYHRHVSDWVSESVI